MTTRNWIVHCLQQRRQQQAVVQGLSRPRGRSFQAAPSWMLAAILTAASGCGQQAPESSPVERRERVRRPVENRDVVVVPPEVIQPPATELAASEFAATEDGFSYSNNRIRSGPWSINVVRIDRSRPDLALTTTLGRGKTLGLSPLSEQLERLPAEAGQPLAAVNGDYYRTEHERFPGDPRGLQISRGELVSGPNGKTAFWIDASGKPRIGNVVSQMKVTWPGGETTPIGLNEERHSNDATLYTSRVGPSTRASGGREFTLVHAGEGPWIPLRIGETYRAEIRSIRESGNSRTSADTMVLSVGRTLLPRIPDVEPGDFIEISTATSPNLSGAELALGGGPVLIRNGKIQSVHSNKPYERHPRTAFGWNDRYYVFAQVDGRQRGFSVGMTLPELASYLQQQGCEEAMNLDGGGSAEMWVKGRVVNRPCFGYERETANALVLVRSEAVAAQ